MRTAVCLSGRLTSIENYENLRQNVLAPYNADVFIDTWIPFGKNSMKVGLLHNTPDEELAKVSILPEEQPADINAYVEHYKPLMINMEFFDASPITHQVRSLLPPSAKTAAGNESHGTKKENVMFMWYKIWKANQMRKLYEQNNRIRYDCIIRARFESTFTSFPKIEPKFKTVYIPNGGDYEGGINDQFALADSQTMDLYCEMYNEIYRYTVAGIGLHPESMLRKHLQVNRLTVERFECGLMLRGGHQSAAGNSGMRDEILTDLNHGRILD